MLDNREKSRGVKRVYYDVRALFDPANLLLVFVNVLAFIVIETIFFWTVASGAVVNEVVRHAEFVNTIASNDENADDLLVFYLNSQEQAVAIPAKAKEQKSEREETNIGLVQSHIGPPAAITLGVIMVLLIIMYVRRERFTFVDFVLLSLVVFAFTTELVFYVLVLSRWRYISTADLVARFFSPWLQL